MFLDLTEMICHKTHVGAKLTLYNWLEL